MEASEVHAYFAEEKLETGAPLHRNSLANKHPFISFPFFTGKLTLPLTEEEGFV